MVGLFPGVQDGYPARARKEERGRLSVKDARYGKLISIIIM
jgi:hypothetical protein